MLIIRQRQLSELRFDADRQQYCGRAIIDYSFPDDPDVVHRARLTANIARPRQTRYSRLESALLDSAALRLIAHFASIDIGPVNIFATPTPPLSRAA